MKTYQALKQLANLTTTLVSQPGATNLESSHAAVNSRGISLDLGESLSQSDHTAGLIIKGGINMTNRMTVTIEEAFQSVQGHYAWIGYEVCPVCQCETLSVIDEDPGSIEEAIGVFYVCEHPTCRAIAGSVVICGTDIDELLRKDTYTLSEMGNGKVECDSVEVCLASILGRRYAVEYMKEREEQEIDFSLFDHYEDDHDEVDLEQEKWNNYWSDYNQCGIRVSY